MQDERSIKNLINKNLTSKLLTKLSNRKAELNKNNLDTRSKLSNLETAIGELKSKWSKCYMRQNELFVNEKVISTKLQKGANKTIKTF